MAIQTINSKPVQPRRRNSLRVRLLKKRAFADSTCSSFQDNEYPVPNELELNLADDPRDVFPKPQVYLAHINGLCSAVQSFFSSASLEHQRQIIQQLDDLSSFFVPAERKSVSSDSSQPEIAMIDVFCIMRHILSNLGEKLGEEIGELILEPKPLKKSSFIKEKAKKIGGKIQNDRRHVFPKPQVYLAHIDSLCSSLQSFFSSGSLEHQHQMIQQLDNLISLLEPAKMAMIDLFSIMRHIISDLGEKIREEISEVVHQDVDSEQNLQKSSTTAKEPVKKSSFKEKAKEIGGKIINFFFGRK